MNSQPALSFLQQMTRKLADTFQELNQLCIQQIDKLAALPPPSQPLTPPPPQQSNQQPVQQPLPLQIESPEEEASGKSTKTKKIKKDGVNQADEKQAQTSRPKRNRKKVSHKPKAPPSSFLLFFKDQQGRIATAYPSYGVTQLTKVAAKLWSEYTAEQKEPYIKQCDEERRVYQERMQVYRVQFPQEIAQKEKDRQNRRKIKNPPKDTPKKEKNPPESGKVKLATDPSVKPQEPQAMVEQEVSESQSIDQNQQDSLGIL